ncbi:MAG TPA: CGNR zinc finger domain-containing protein [Propionibacteriaceae bacterium]|nr:CGNR zinc finger domain-containing protein [Propionibacteriaceae bacterium]
MLGLALGDLSSRGYDLERLRRCADQDCGWFFLDTSRNRTRRWCDPGDCGNRNRVKAFAARHRPAGLPSNDRHSTMLHITVARS